MNMHWLLAIHTYVHNQPNTNPQRHMQIRALGVEGPVSPPLCCAAQVTHPYGHTPAQTTIHPRPPPLVHNQGSSHTGQHVVASYQQSTILATGAGQTATTRPL